MRASVHDYKPFLTSLSTVSPPTSGGAMEQLESLEKAQKAAATWQFQRKLFRKQLSNDMDDMNII